LARGLFSCLLFSCLFSVKQKIIFPAVTGATESGADIEDTTGSASLQAADDGNGIFSAPLSEKTPQD
ncbi:MAG: hypothetical protein ACLTKZ_04445, partial [Lachnospiraceae bacterium]